MTKPTTAASAEAVLGSPAIEARSRALSDHLVRLAERMELLLREVDGLREEADQESPLGADEVDLTD